MELIIDANILFSALIKESVTSELLMNSKIKLYSPEFVFEEFIKYKEIILRKTKRNSKNFNKIFSIFEEKIILVKIEYLKDFEEKAKIISPDINDYLYFALALKLNCPIWTNDKLLKEQDIVEIMSTHELVKLI